MGLRVGASADPPWVQVQRADAPPSGIEVQLVEGFARHLGVRVEWMISGESDLMGELEDGAADVVVGGLLADSPWEQRVALTRPYTETPASDGTTQQHVMAAPMGENALLVELERYLDGAAS